jgi:hypothetical protein
MRAFKRVLLLEEFVLKFFFVSPRRISFLVPRMNLSIYRDLSGHSGFFANAI